MKKKIILICSKAITVNTFLDQLIIDLKKNFELIVYVSDPENIKIKCKKEKINLPIKYIDFINIFKFFKYLINTRKIFKEKKDYEIFVHTPLAAHFVRLALLLEKKKIIYFVHGFRFHNKTNIIFYIFFASIEYLLKFKTKYYFLINKEDKYFVKNILKKKFYLINGIGIFLKKKIKKNFSNKKKFIVGIIAAYRSNKGYDDLISISNKLKNKKIKFMCFGYGDKNKYYDKIKSLNLQRKIYLYDFKKNIEKYIVKFDVLLHASLREGLPISLLQCLYYNIPVIGRDIRGVNDLITNKKHGYLIKNDFVNKSSAYIDNLSQEKKKLKVFKKNISKINFKNFSKKKISKKINIILKKNYEI